MAGGRHPARVVENVDGPGIGNPVRVSLSRTHYKFVMCQENRQAKTIVLGSIRSGQGGNVGNAAIILYPVEKACSRIRHTVYVHQIRPDRQQIAGKRYPHGEIINWRGIGSSHLGEVSCGTVALHPKQIGRTGSGHPVGVGISRSYRKQIAGL